MKKNWVTETAKMLKRVNDKTEHLLKQNLPEEEFHKRHQEIMDYWDAETIRLRKEYPVVHKFQARPKYNHKTTHMSEKFQAKKIFNQFFND